MTPIENRSRNSENLAFWIAPLVSPIPLIPFFSLPWSPLFLGKLMGNLAAILFSYRDGGHGWLRPAWRLTEPSWHTS